MQWLNKEVKKKIIMCQLQELSVGLMQDTDIISIRHWGWTLLPIPYLLGDIIKTETLYRLFCPATYISLLFDTITLNMLWLQRFPGMNFSLSPNGVLYLCDPPSWFLATRRSKDFSVVAIWLYCSAEDCTSNWNNWHKFRSGYPGQGEGIYRCDFTQV